MELARVIGNVVATIKDPSLEGFKLLVLQPLDHHQNEVGEPFVALDPLLAGEGDVVAWIGGREASLAMPHELSPVDAAIVEIIDAVYPEDEGAPPREVRERVFGGATATSEAPGGAGEGHPPGDSDGSEAARGVGGPSIPGCFEVSGAPSGAGEGNLPDDTEHTEGTA